MNQEIETPKFRFQLCEIAWLTFLAVLAILGLSFIIIGTGASTVGRYMASPKILPGIAILDFSALLMAVTIAKKNSSFLVLRRLKEFIIKKMGQPERENMRNMVLMLTSFTIAFSMAKGVNLRSQIFANSYFFGLFANVFMSLITSIGVFCWLSSLFISKQSKEKS